MYKLGLSMFAGLAVAVLALTPPAAYAAGHGGGRGGGFHGGGGYSRGYGYGGWGWGGPYYGGWGSGLGYGYPAYSGYDYGPSYSNGTAPYSGSYPSSYYDDSPGYSVRQGDSTATGSSYSYGAYASPPPTIPTAVNAARIRVIVPKDAKVWFEGTPTHQTGSVRQFVSPPLTAGKQYTYNILATWTEAGRVITQTRSLPVWPNTNASVDFTGADMSLD
jgi:uncharacterized protein (TIGR03000 family)